MVKMTKPYYTKSSGEKIFKALRQEAQEIVATSGTRKAI